jgi:signal peptidase I
MQKKGILSRIIANILLIVGLATIWIAFTPLKLGGQVAYVMVNGTSMEPDFHGGDIALVRKSTSYQVGDVVTYRDNEMEAYIIHRIVGTVQDRFIMKGDNNTWIDGSRPTSDEIVGKLWFRIPQLGVVLKWMQVPIHAALIVVLLGGLLMFSSFLENRAKKKRTKRVQNSIGLFQAAVYFFGLLAVLFLAITVLSFSQPLQKLAGTIPYKQTGVFSYSAAGNTDVYDSGSALSGEPVFTKLTCTLQLGFNYALQGDQLTGIKGTQQYYARISDQDSGWQRIIPMNNAVNFSGNTANTTTTFDLCQAQSMISAMETGTGFRLNTSYTLDIISKVNVNGKISGQDFSGLFEPRLSFRFDSVHFYLETNTAQADPLTTVQSEVITSTKQIANSIKFFGLNPTIQWLRSVGTVGLGISLFLLLGLAVYFCLIQRHNPEAITQLKYSGLLIDVKDQNIEAFNPVIDVASIDDLAKLAERGNVLMLHLTTKDTSPEHYYLAQVEGTNYCYRSGKHEQG